MDRVAVVTGASSGIGREVARTLATEGCHVLLVARRAAILDQLAHEIDAHTAGSAVTLSVDVTDEEAPQAMSERLLGWKSRVDILVNSAGRSWPVPLGDAHEDALWREGFMLNFVSNRRITHALLPQLIAQGFGRVVNITGPTEPVELNAGNAAKAAVHAWAKALSNHVARSGVTVNCVAPGRIMSEQVRGWWPTAEERDAFAQAHIPVGRFGMESDVARVVTFLCSPHSGYITGEIINVDGGMRRFAY